MSDKLRMLESRLGGRTAGMVGLGLAVAAAVCCAARGGAPAAAEPLLRGNFVADPAAQGWQLRSCGAAPADGAWSADGTSPDRCRLVVRQGFWESPAVAVAPCAYYRLRFAARTPPGAYCGAVFLDAAGQELPADVYDGVDAAEDWAPQTLCFRAHPAAARVRLRFQAGSGPLWIDEVTLEAIDGRQAAAWADAVAADCSALAYQPPHDAVNLLPRTQQALGRGGRLRIVMLGDSICNDVSNSLFETVWQRAHPCLRPEVITSVRGGAGCDYFEREGQVRAQVLAHDPDLVIVGGISHQFDPEPFRRVVQQIRAGSTCDILIFNGAICPTKLTEEEYIKRARLPKETALRNVSQFAARLREMAAEEKVAFLDMRSAWDDYVSRASQPDDWFRRDAIHANRRGKQIVGRILLRYLDPLTKDLETR